MKIPYLQSETKDAKINTWHKLKSKVIKEETCFALSSPILPGNFNRRCGRKIHHPQRCGRKQRKHRKERRTTRASGLFDRVSTGISQRWSLLEFSYFLPRLAVDRCHRIKAVRRKRPVKRGLKDRR